jgi:hypothetical protein
VVGLDEVDPVEEAADGAVADREAVEPAVAVDADAVARTGQGVATEVDAHAGGADHEPGTRAVEVGGQADVAGDDAAARHARRAPGGGRRRHGGEEDGRADRGAADGAGDAVQLHGTAR